MVRDVYRDDDQLLRPAAEQPPEQAFRFRIEADADPDVWGRVAGLFTLANVPPETASLWRQGDGLVIMVELRGLTAERADSIRRKLAQLSSVRTAELQVIETRTKNESREAAA